MTAVERAAEVQRAADIIDTHWYCPPVSIPSHLPNQAALALIDAGWHDGPVLSDADRAVLDAADDLDRIGSQPTDQRKPAGSEFWAAYEALKVAVRARREQS